jgi:sec-independent protein translocase protein TatC
MPPSRPPNRDLFDDTTMTFGEHLEALRTHLIKALVGLVLGVLVALTFSHHIIRYVQTPVVRAMEEVFGVSPDMKPIESIPFWSQVSRWWSGKKEDPAATPTSPSAPEPMIVTLEVHTADLLALVDKAMPGMRPKPPDGTPLPPERVQIQARVPELEELRSSMRKELFAENLRARTDGPDEAFMIYIKVSVVTGLVLTSPWVFYQLWMFVAAGLYPHERHYVYKYLPLSIILFVGGALFAFFAVIPFVLTFLFQFNAWLELRPEMKIGTWLNFAMFLSLMFGISFQLPLVMVFLEKLTIFEAKDYREKRRMSILAISIISMLLTPSDPISMVLMMVPLCILYELGIVLCGPSEPVKGPFPAGAKPASPKTSAPSSPPTPPAPTSPANAAAPVVQAAAPANNQPNADPMAGVPVDPLAEILPELPVPERKSDEASPEAKAD